MEFFFVIKKSDFILKFRFRNIFLLDRRKKSVSHVRFTSINLSKIDETILSGFVSRLTAVILDLNYLTLAQTKAIFEKVRSRSRDITLLQTGCSVV